MPWHVIGHQTGIAPYDGSDGWLRILGTGCRHSFHAEAVVPRQEPSSARVNMRLLTPRSTAPSVPSREAMRPLPGQSPGRGPSFVIGFSGPPAAGKSTAGRRLAEEGWFLAAFGDTVRALSTPGEDLVEAAHRVRHDFGQPWLCQQVLSLIGNHTRAVVDGLRFDEDLDYFRRHLRERFLHIHLTADPQSRSRRFIQRGGSRETFDRRESDLFQSEVHRLAQQAHISIRTDGPLKDWTSVIVCAASLFTQGPS